MLPKVPDWSFDSKALLERMEKCKPYGGYFATAEQSTAWYQMQTVYVNTLGMHDALMVITHMNRYKPRAPNGYRVKEKELIEAIENLEQIFTFYCLTYTAR